MSGSSTFHPRYYEKASWNLAAAIIFPVIDTFVVGLRLYARRKQKLRLQVDDWLTIPSLIGLYGVAIAMIIGIAKHAVGYPTPSDLQEQTEAVLVTSKVEWAVYLITMPAVALIKLSILTFYYRIFCVQRTSPSSLFILFMIVLTIMWGIAFFFYELFVCEGHFSAYWGSADDAAKYCGKPVLDFFTISITDFIMDAIIILIPLPLLWKVQLPMSKKIAVAGIFLLGSGAIGASCARMVFSIKDYKNGFNPNDDEDYDITGLLYWSTIEVGVGLLAACLPTIRVIFKGFSPDSVINSIRSAFSLHSLRSTRSRLYGDTNRPSNDRDRESTASKANIVEPKAAHNGSSKGFAMSDLNQSDNC